MKIELHDRLGNPERRDATRLVVYDDYGNAVVSVLKLGEGMLDVRVAGQPGFNEALKFLGVEQTLIVDKLDVEQLGQVRQDSVLTQGKRI